MSVQEMTVAQQITDRLDRVNGRRRTRTLTARDVMDTIGEASAPGSPGYAVRHAGTVASAYDYPAWTTIVLAARIDGVVYCNIARATAKATTPGRAWPEVQPWPRGDMAAKLRQWAARPDTIRVD